MKRTCIFLMASCFAVGVFGAQKYSVTTSLSGDLVSGSKAPADKMVEAGKKVTITVTPGKNRFVDKWIYSPKGEGGDGIPVFGAGSSYTFVMPEKDVSLEAFLVDETTDAQDLKALDFKFAKFDSCSDAVVEEEDFLEIPSGLFFRGILKTSSWKAPYTKLTATFTGLPKGLSVSPTTRTELIGRNKDFHVVTHQCWIIEGVATEPLDRLNAPAFVTFTSQGKATRCMRVPLHVSGPLGYATTSVKIGQTFPSGTVDSFVKLGTGWTVKKGLPPGITVNKATGILAGTPTAAGRYLVECSRKVTVEKKSYTETAAFEIFVEPSSDNASIFGNLPKSFSSNVGEDAARNFGPYLLNGTSPNVTGLPPGLKYTAKDVSITSGGKTQAYSANYVYGTPTKAGSYVVTLSKKVGSTAYSQQTIWNILPAEAPELGTIALRDDQGGMQYSYWNDWNDWDASAVAYAGQILDETEYVPNSDRGPFAAFKVPSGASLSMSGHPSGVKLVKVQETSSYATYAICGMVTKAGNYAISVKVTKNGATSLLRFNLGVRENPIQGNLRGSVNSEVLSVVPGSFHEGEAIADIDAAGTLKLTLNDGRKKATITFKGYRLDGDRFATFTGIMPNEKNTPARTIEVTVRFYESACGICVPYRASGSISCAANDDYERDIWLFPRMDERFARIIEDEDEEEITVGRDTVQYEYFTFGANATGVNWMNKYFDYACDFAGGYVALAHKVKSGENDCSQATATGRTPDGAKFSTTIYPLFDDEDSETYRYSPIVVYNKATGRTWRMSVIDRDRVALSFYDDDAGRPSYALYGEGSEYSEDDVGLQTCFYKDSMYDDFAMFVNDGTRIYDGKALDHFNLPGALENNYNPGNGTYAYTDELVDELGVLKGADPKVTWNKSTGVVSFKREYNGNVHSFEGVPAGPGWIRGWSSYTKGGRTYNGLFNFRVP